MIESILFITLVVIGLYALLNKNTRKTLLKEAKKDIEELKKDLKDDK